MKNTVNLFHLATHLFILTTYPQKPFKKRLLGISGQNESPSGGMEEINSVFHKNQFPQ